MEGSRNEQATDERQKLELTAEIVSAYVGNNPIPQGDVSTFINSVYATLSNLGQPVKEPEAERPVPPVPIKKSVQPDYIISLETGKPFKSLRRHLSTLGMTPDEYRKKWGLPPDYPMVAPSYSQQRSDLAKQLGLGSMRRRGEETVAEEEAPAAEAPRRRGRKAS